MTREEMELIGMGGEHVGDILYPINGLMFVIPALLVLFFGKSTAGKSLEQIEDEALC